MATEFVAMDMSLARESWKMRAGQNYDMNHMNLKNVPLSICTKPAWIVQKAMPAAVGELQAHLSGGIGE